MSHNPVTPGLYDILDRVGVVAMDETRELHSDPISIMNMGAMVKRDRSASCIHFCFPVGTVWVTYARLMTLAATARRPSECRDLLVL